MMTTLAHFREDEKRVHYEGGEGKKKMTAQTATNKFDTSQGSNSVIMFDALSQTMAPSTRFSVGAKNAVPVNHNKGIAVCKLSLSQTG